MPLPPGGLPVAGEGHRERRFAEEDEGDEDRERQGPGPGAEELGVAPDPEAVGGEADDRQCGERAPRILGSDREDRAAKRPASSKPIAEAI
jgi:hypothetical protein